MTLPASGAISLGDVMTELRVTNPGRAYPISLGDSDVRALAGVASGQISLSNLYGKTGYIAMSGSVPNASDSAGINPSANYNYDVPISISLSGGVAPYAYAWTKLSGGAADSVIAANAAETSARFNINRFATPGEVHTTVAQCVVTDGAGNSITRSGTITLTLTE